MLLPLISAVSSFPPPSASSSALAVACACRGLWGRRRFVSVTRPSLSAAAGIAHQAHLASAFPGCLRRHRGRAGNGMPFARTTSSATSPSSTLAVVFSAYGPPASVLRVESRPLEPVEPSYVKVKFLASPINPADINQIQGSYPIKPTFIDGTAIGGNEGLAQVIEVGSAVTSLRVGDRVLPYTTGFGTWRQYAVADEKAFLKVNAEGVSDISVATVTVNPCTAFRMLSDFVDLKEGDAVVQNGATSAVGQAVIQIARVRGLKSINIIRDRPNLDETVASLKALGADLVFTEEQIRLPATTKAIKALCGQGQPKLGLNCVGGKSATNVARILGSGGFHVTYGGMSKEPLAIPTSLLIFTDLHIRGFWMTRWFAACSQDAKADMLNELFGMMRAGKFREPFHDRVALLGEVADAQRNVLDAVERAQAGMARKQILVSQEYGSA
ncbi:hypothetical protein DFJ73DRAFT_849906 [Zopfochytrium polystomum]|nr:hypothetical protein DFJ73DRAFT_849906 [Zopfochytrium polystomum]